jgi:hypothetical protein
MRILSIRILLLLLLMRKFSITITITHALVENLLNKVCPDGVGVGVFTGIRV